MNMIMQTPTPELKQSLEFYNTLNFNVITSTEKSVVFSDGSAILEVNSDKQTRAGVKLYVDSVEGVMSNLKDISFYGSKAERMFNTPSGIRVCLLPIEDKPKYKVDEISPSIIGSYAGLSLETPDIEGSIKLWQALGFKVSMGGKDQGWVALSNTAGDSVSLMKMMSCPHLFFNPSLTYFNGAENLGIIKKVKDAGIQITEEITVFNHEGIVDNIIIRDPGGFGFFIFSD